MRRPVVAAPRNVEVVGDLKLLRFALGAESVRRGILRRWLPEGIADAGNRGGNFDRHRRVRGRCRVRHT